MANPSMTLISSKTVGSGGAASIDFTGIPQTGFTDLLIVVSGRSNRSATEDGLLISINGSTANFTSRALRGSGSAATSITGTRALGDIPAASATSNTFANQSIYIPNYAGSTSKSFSVDSVSENNATSAWQYAVAGLWSNTSAITSISLTPEVGSALVQHSTASLYGVTKSDNTFTAKATGGTITSDIGYVYHTFTSSGTFAPTAALTADILVIAGGGAGSQDRGGAGGAGGLQGFSNQSLSVGSYTVTVGAGGAGAPGGQGANGSPSQFGSLTASVGGGGGGDGSTGANGRSGGSGGGGGNYPSIPTGAGGAGTAGQGYAGGTGTYTSPNYGAGGGGGAGGVGGNGWNTGSGSGGPGVNTYSSWAAATATGVNGYYAGGGGAGSYMGGTNGSGGAGGGGNGVRNGTSNPGVANTGGGGGSNGEGGSGGSGGSGLVIIRYAK